MQFTSSALWLALFSVSTTTTLARSLNAPAIQERMNQIPALHWLRNLEEEEWEITGDYSVRFNECLSLSVLSNQEDGDNNGDDNNNNNLSSTATADYVILDVISSYDGSVRNFAIDLSTFVTTLVNYIPDQMESYCEACDYDYCLYGGDNANGDDANNDDQDQQQEDGEGDDNQGDDRRLRHLEQNDGKIVYVECDMCNSLSCFDDDENQQQDDGNNNVLTNEYAVEWLLDLGECQAIDEDNSYNYYNQNGYQLYAGYACNSDGTGMEIGVFQDEDCSVLSSDTSFGDVLASGGNAATYQSMTANLVRRVFAQYFDCMNTEYVNPNQDADDNEEGDDENDEDGDFEANEYCQQLLEENSFAMDESCSDEDGDNDDNYQYDEDGNPWGQYTDANGNVIYYDVQDAEDMGQVCFAIQGKNGEYSTATGSSGQSSLYDYSNPKKNLNDDDNWAWDSGKDGQNDGITGSSSGESFFGKVSNMAAEYGLSSAEMWGIIAGSILLSGFLLVGVYKCMCGKKRKATLALDDHEDAVTRSRREPLVNNPEVYIA